MLSLNGYSKNFTYSIINKELEKRLSGVEKPVYEGPDRLKVYMKLPYIGDMSSKVKECIKKGLSGKFELILSNKYSKLNQKFTFKDRQPKHLKSDLVYEIKCSCGRRYVGETCRALKTRFDEHMKTEGSNMTEAITVTLKGLLEDSRSFNGDPPHLTLNHGFPVIRLSRPKKIA
ncbi:hypothetical protein ACHWQZ_G001552 [Mnemiopsis leidyi]